ncbi:MAG: ABC transporter substrate-binding protein [Alphaproteobacteria bacterium]|nr:ABC transporter substrate-binding protein [Alphaproteobacteria bacterium]
MMIRNFCGRASFRARAVGMLLGAAGISLIGAAAEPTAARTDEAVALKIGLLMDFSGGSAEVLRDRRRAFELAIEHVNGGGGVFGLPVAVAVGDATADPEKAVAAARRLVEVERVHAVVGPNASASALPVAERVTGPAGIPTVSFSATSPELTGAADDDFLFRTALSDVSQGPVLARVARERGFDNVGLLYVDDPWGRGLAGAFEAAWDGAVKAVPVNRGRTGFLTELRESASGGAQALVVIAFETAALAMVREAIDDGLYDRFVFGDAAKRLSLVRSIGGTRLGDMYGTGPATAPESVSSAAWEAAYVDEHGALPVLAYVKEAYDATVVLALAAQAAGRLDGAAIRDRLRAVGGGPGTVVTAGPRGVADALRILAEGGEVDYEGASGSMDWDGNGDLRRGHVGIWRFTGDERIEDVEAVPFGR